MSSKFVPAFFVLFVFFGIIIEIVSKLKTFLLILGYAELN